MTEHKSIIGLHDTTPASADASPGGKADGWLFHNPDTGTEWSESHPVESGECEDATDIRPADLSSLKSELFDAWKALTEDRSTPSHTGTAESDDAAFVEQIIGLSQRMTGDIVGDRHRRVSEALARRATTKSETDKAAVTSAVGDAGFGDEDVIAAMEAREIAVVEGLDEHDAMVDALQAFLRSRGDGPLARTPATKSETDGAAHIDDATVEALRVRLRWYDSEPARNTIRDMAEIIAAALARTSAAEERPLVARACLLQTRGQHPHTALPCTQCHFGPCEVCL